ncbi:MAG: hydroxymethylbilane synthase [Mucispirillum sp.]|nr:hydroxymethylbilane synthase [Mucispirillum sp.]
MKKDITIATRGSKLALWQAEFIKDKLERYHKGLSCRLEIIKTTGDKILDVPLAKIGGKGLFVKEIEQALFEKKADLAVHSMKHVPMDLPDGLELYASPKAETPNDAFLSVNYGGIDELPIGARVGTSSLRRKLQLLELRPDLKVSDLRGNVQTRIQKLEDGVYDAIILAEAGLVRLGLTDMIKEVISADRMLPASCQGILGVEVRSGDTEIKEILFFLKDRNAETRALCERAFLRKLQGGCQAPIGCHSVIKGDELSAKGIIYSLDGSKKIAKEITGNINEPELTGEKLATMVLDDGGEDILKEIYEN